MNLDRIISVQNSITVFRDGDRCLKVFNEDCAKADVINEALNQARMEQTTVTVPEILEITRVNGKWAIVSEYIKGENLEQLIAKHPEKTGEYMALFASLHCRIHSIRAWFSASLRTSALAQSGLKTFTQRTPSR